MSAPPDPLAVRLRQGVIDSYETPQAVAFYSQAVGAGLKVSERAVVDRLFGEGSGVREILVIGCGGGRELFALEALGYDVAGVDVAPALVAAAQEEASRRESRARIELVDGLSLPFAAAEFDAVVMWSQVLGHVPLAAHRCAFLTEARRVVRLGGAMNLTAHDAALTLPLLAQDRIVSRDIPEPGDMVVTETREAAARYFRYFTEEDLRGLCAAAGFVVTDLTHSDELGDAWGNVFVLTGRAI